MASRCMKNRSIVYFKTFIEKILGTVIIITGVRPEDEQALASKLMYILLFI